jgi:subtilase family serine protease
MRFVKSIFPALLMASCISSVSYATVPDRITAEINASEMVALKGNVHGLAQPRFDLGRADASKLLHGITLAFRPSTTQQQDLNNLLAQQQDRSSPNYHKWLTPAQFADRFGMTRGDIQRVTAWLQSQGFAVTAVANSRNEISFDGTVSQIEVAFATEIHNYLVNGELHFANSTDPSVPSALAGSVLAIGHLHDFAPKPRAKARPHLTSYVSGNHFVTPGDFATIYDVAPLYSAGSDGTGQKIAIVGQSSVNPTDLSNFRSAAGLPASTVTMTLVEGTSTRCSGDEGESDLDLEWSGGVAKNASIIFVYAGLGTGDTCANRVDDVWDALDYAVQNNVAPIISTSYGFCEGGATGQSGVGQAFALQVQQTAQHANLQGQTIVAASGDSGAADCDPNSTDPNDTSATQGFAVDVPAAIPEVTGMGGNTFSADSPTYTTNNPPGANPPYWAAAGSTTDTVSSALEYIPEDAWNDTAADLASPGGSLSASGGGASIFFAKPTWQTGTGVPADGKRDVPDLSFAASPNHDGYLVCSEDGANGAIQSSCTAGFRTGSGGTFTVVGGTSVAAPTFSAILALINESLGNTPPSGLGNVNPNLYTFAGSNPSAFHDVTTGNNIVPCTSGTPNCPATAPFQFGFSAGTGYDQVTGLGSVDADKLAIAWAASITRFLTSATPLTPASVSAGNSVTSTVTITPQNGFNGTVTLGCTGLPPGATCTFNPPTIAGSSGTTQLTVQTQPNTAAATTTVTVMGTSGAASNSTPVSLVVTATTESFSLTSNLTGGTLSVAQGATSGPVNLTVTSSTGFIVTSGSSASTVLPLTYTCTGLPNGATCNFSPSSTSSQTVVSFTISTTAPTVGMVRPSNGGSRIFYAAVLPGFLAIMFVGSRKRSRCGMRVLALIVVLGFSTLWLGSCGGTTNSSNSNPGTPKGTSTVTVNAKTTGAAPITGLPALTFQFTVN